MMTVAANPAELAARAVELLSATFKPDRAGLLRLSGDDEAEDRDLELAASHGGRGAGSQQAETLVLRDAERALIDEARFEGRLVEGRIAASHGGGTVDSADSAYAVPLVSRGECLGCLYLHSRCIILQSLSKQCDAGLPVCF